MSQALLLAEAEPGTREFLARHLASDGFAVLGADAGREALELVERDRPDLVLVGGRRSRSAASCARASRAVPGTATCP
jgi:DNA-binding response OmpR family regulator